MIEPEIAHAALDDLLDLAEKHIRFTAKHVLETLDDTIAYLTEFEKFWLKRQTSTDLYRPAEPLDSRLKKLVETTQFTRITYSDALELLNQHEFSLAWGDDLPSEAERFLAEDHFKVCHLHDGTGTCFCNRLSHHPQAFLYATQCGWQNSCCL